MVTQIHPDQVSHGGQTGRPDADQDKIVAVPVSHASITLAGMSSPAQPADAPELRASALPGIVKVGSLLDPRLRLRVPLTVEVHQEDGLLSVWQPDLDEFGSGEFLGDALEDFQHTVADLYFTLRDNVDKLGPLMQRHWEFARRVIEERP